LLLNIRLLFSKIEKADFKNEKFER